MAHDDPKAVEAALSQLHDNVLPGFEDVLAALDLSPFLVAERVDRLESVFKEVTSLNQEAW